MQANKEPKISSFKNVVFMMKLIFKASPERIFISTIKRIIQGVFYVFFFVYLMQYIFESIENGVQFNRVFWFLTALAAGHIVIHIIAATYDYYMLRNNPKLFRYIYGRVIAKATKMPLYKFESPKYYDKYAKALEEAQFRAEKVIADFANGMSSIASIVTVVFLILQWDPVILLFPLLPIVNSLFINKYRSKLYLERKNAMIKDYRSADYCKRIFYEKKYAGEIRLFPIKKLFFDLHQTSYDHMTHTMKQYNKKIMLLEIWDNFLIRVIMVVLCTVYATYQILVLDHLSIGIYVSLMGAINNIAGSVRGIMYHASELMNHGKLIQNLRSFLDEGDEDQKDRKVRTYKKAGSKGRKDRVPTMEIKVDQELEGFQTLSLHNVTYTYQGASTPVINHLNLTIHKGEKIAFVGHNGAGKTTLVKLIMGLYEISEGEISYNETNISHLSKDQYKRKFATIFQDFQIYALSIACNVIIREARTKEDEQRVLDALYKAGLGEKVNQLKKGIHSNLTHEFDDEGVILSGGESQKIALARVFARNDSELVILDEPSSALDPISEFNMYQNMMKAASDKTVIFISHRLSSARMADKIYLLEHGSIIEQGTHDELMKLNGNYAYMFHLQAQNYVNEDIDMHQADLIVEG